MMMKMKGKGSKNEADDNVSVTCSLFGPESAAVPFPEWSDLEIRSENWNDPAPKIVKERSHVSTSGVLTAVDLPVTEHPTEFEDNQIIGLPHNIVAYNWKRVSTVFPEAKLEVYIEENNYPDLINKNKHILHSEFMRSFISSVYMLTYLGDTTKFTIEHVSSNFNPATSKKPWKPWHHIYSNNTAGSPNKHEPTFNKVGKYVVRLFWMGAWRRVYVDDRVPVDLLDNVMLPSVAGPDPAEKIKRQSKSHEVIKDRYSVASVKPVIIEIWPFLLSKALLKIASLTWHDEKEIVDFDIIQCLTGWIPQKISTKGLSSLEKWKLCWAYTNHFAWPPKESGLPEEAISSSNAQNSNTTQNTDQQSNETSRVKRSSHTEQSDQPSGKRSIQSKISEHPPPSEQDDEETEDKLKQKLQEGLTTGSEVIFNPCHVVAHCNNLRNMAEEDKISNLFPCWAHHFLIQETRNIPLLESPLTADLPNWKKFRWLEWAAQKGLIPYEELLAKIRSYRIVSPFRKVCEHLVHKQPSKITINTDLLHQTELESDFKKVKKGKTGEKTPKGDKKTGQSKGSKEKKTSVLGEEKPLPDPSFWEDYEKLSHEINTITIYFKPSEFSSKVELSDVNKQSKPRKDSTVELKGSNITNLLKCRNEPIYIYLDTTDNKLMVINFSQTGYTGVFHTEKMIESNIMIPDRYTECEFCLASLVKRVKRNVTKEDIKDYAHIQTSEVKEVKHDRPHAYLVLEVYNWKTDKVGETVATINTYGSKAIVLNLGPGRKLFKLWLKSDNHYALQIYSNVDMVVDNLEKILYTMTQESQFLEHVYCNIANKFEDLVKSFGEPEFKYHLKLFYNCYKPQERLTKSESLLVHEALYSLLLKLVEDYFSPREMFAMKVLFLRWQRTYSPDEIEGYDLCNCYDGEDLEYLKMLEKYVTKIQAFFRGIYDRSLMKYHNKLHKNYNTVAHYLNNIYSQIFSSHYRILSCPNLVREFFMHPNLDKIKEKFYVYHELDNVLTLKEVMHNTKIVEGQWAFICRQQFVIKPGEPIIIRIHLFCNVEQYVVRVIDNDTCVEMKRYTNNVAVNEYKPNTKGYTAICYVWSPTTQVLNYKLCFAMKKEVNQDRFVLIPANTQVNIFSGSYLPNINNIICKYTMKIRADRSLISAYFASCQEDVIIKLRLTDDKGKIFYEITGQGSIILPAIVLENRKKSSIKDTGKSDSTTDKKRFKGVAKSPDKKYSIAVQAQKTRPKGPSDRFSSPSIPRLESRKKLVGSETARTHASICEIKDLKRNVLNDEPDTYCIEISVENDSWPLNSEEWRNVKNIRAVEPARPTMRSSIRASISIKGSNLSLRKPSMRHRPSTRTSQEFRRLESAFGSRKPFWTLNTICNSGEFVDISKDNKRELEITKIKFKWGEDDQNRYEKAKRLRKQFLDENKIPNRNFIRDEDYTIRSLVADDFAVRTLPPLNLSEYMKKDPAAVESKRIMKDENALKRDLQREVQLMAKVEETFKKSKIRMEKISADQEKYMQITNAWVQGFRSESRQLMTAAMKQKSACIDQMWEDLRNKEDEEISSADEEKGKKRNAGNKKGKKDKKG